MENPKPLVTVITIFFNAEEFIKEAIDSVLRQTYENWQLFLVDDGSKDRGTDIAIYYASKYKSKISYLKHANHVNMGMNVSRNLGIKYSRGKYISFIDADDIWLQEKLEKQVEILEKYPQVAMVYGPIQFWYSWTDKPEDSIRDFVPDLGVEADRIIPPPTLFNVCYPIGNKICPTTTDSIVRKDVIMELGDFECLVDGQFQIHEDRPFFSKIYINKPVYVTSKSYSKYRQHSGSSVNSVKKSNINYHKSKLNYLMWLESYLKYSGNTNLKVARELKKSLKPYIYPITHKIVQYAKCYLDKLKMICNFIKRILSFKSAAFVTVSPNPLYLPNDMYGNVILSWWCHDTDEIEIREGSTDGTLYYKGKSKGKMNINVSDGQVFYLQDISDKKGINQPFVLSKIKIFTIPRVN